MHQSVIEVGTRVCKTIQEARENIQALRREVITLASEHGMLLAAASTHPFSDWKLQEIYPDERYARVVEDMQLIARANLVFGLHVHIGIEDRNTAIHIMNSMRYFLPHILALSTNSPFWMGMNSGFKSYRCKVFERFPARRFPTSLPTGRNTRILSRSWSRPIASTTARRSGGTFARIPSSTPSRCGCATFLCGWTRPLPLPR